MSMPIGEIKGLPQGLDGKLKEVGVHNADELLARCATPKARKEFATSLALDPKVLLEIANRADLSRLTGVAGVFSDLLENAGVDTVKELAGRVPENLHAKLAEVNAAQKISARTPTVDQVTAWIEEAKKLPKVLEY